MTLEEHPAGSDRIGLRIVCVSASVAVPAVLRRATSSNATRDWRLVTLAQRHPLISLIPLHFGHET